MPHAEPLSDRLLEPLAEGPLREPAAADDLLEGWPQRLGGRQRGPDERHADSLPRRIAGGVDLGDQLKSLTFHRHRLTISQKA
jgi:hypothetical protein